MIARIPSPLRRFAACMVMLAILCVGVSLSSVHAADLVGNSEDVTEQPFGGQFNFIQFKPLSTPQAIGTNTIWPSLCQARIIKGFFSAHLVGGWYDAGIPPVTKWVRIFVDPFATNVLQFNDCALLATNTSFFFITNPLSLLASTQYVISAVSPLASKVQLAAASNTLFSAIQAAAGAAGVVSFNARTGMITLTGGDVAYALGLNPVDRTVTNGLASTGYVASAVSAGVSGLASTAYVGAAIGTATSGLASTGYVAGAVSTGVSGMASTGYVGAAVSGLASTGYVATAIAAIPPFAVAAGTNVTVQTNGQTFTVNASGAGEGSASGALTNGQGGAVLTTPLTIGSSITSTQNNLTCSYSANLFNVAINSKSRPTLQLNEYVNNVQSGTMIYYHSGALYFADPPIMDGSLISNIRCSSFATTNNPQAGYYLRVDVTGTNLYYSPN